MASLREQRTLIEELLEKTVAVSEVIDDSNCMVNECLRLIRFLLRAEIKDLTSLIEEEEGLPSDEELKQLISEGKIG